MRRTLRSAAPLGAIVVAILLAGAVCSWEDEVDAPPTSPVTGTAPTPRARAGESSPGRESSVHAASADTAPPPSSADLDRVVAGRSVREWIAVIAADDRNAPQALADARAALAGDRESAVRALLAMLAADPGEGWTRIRVLAQDLREDLVPGLLALRGHSDPLVQTTVENELRRMARTGGFGVHDGAVVQAFLVGGLDPQEIELLRGMGAAARPAVVEIMARMREEGGGGAWTSETFEALGSFGDAAAGSADGIAEYLRLRDGSPRAEEEYAAFHALAKIPLGPSREAAPSGHVLSVLRSAVNSDRAWWLGAATRVLVSIGRGHEAHAAILAALAGDHTRRNEAFNALYALDELPPGALDILIDIARSDATDGWSAAALLAYWAARDESVLLALLNSTPTESDRYSYTSLLLIEPERAVPAPLLRAFRAKDPAVRLAALRFASRDLPFYLRPTVLRWARVLSDDADASVSTASRQLAAALDAEDRAAGRAVATSDVAARLLNGSPSERDAAVQGIRAADAEPVEVVQSLVSVVDLDDAEQIWNRMTALGALQAIGPRASAALPAIAKILRNPETEPYLFDAAARAAGAIGGDGLALLAEQVRRRGETQGLIDGIAVLPQSSVPAMLEALNDRDADVRAAFLRGLRWHDAEAEALVGRARTLLGDRSGAVRVAAAGTVLHRTPGDPDALRALGDVLCGEIAAGDDVLDAAVWEVANLGSRATALLPGIERVLRNPVSCATWSLAASAAGNCGDAGGPAASALSAALDGRLTCTADGCRHYESRAVAAATALRRLGRASLPARPSIERATRNADDRVATIARAILASFDEKQALAGTR